MKQLKILGRSWYNTDIEDTTFKELKKDANNLILEMYQKGYDLESQQTVQTSRDTNKEFLITITLIFTPIKDQNETNIFND